MVNPQDKLRSPFSITLGQDERQSRRTEGIELEDPDMNRQFHSWFSDLWHFNKMRMELDHGIKWERNHHSSPGLDKMRIWNLQKQIQLGQGQVPNYFYIRTRFAMEASANLVKDTLIELAEYAMRLEEENRQLRQSQNP